MNITIRPAPLAGTVRVPSSKSMTHREIIAAALAKGETEVTGVTWSEDIEATVRILSLFGAAIEKKRERMALPFPFGEGLQNRKASFMPMPANRAPPSVSSSPWAFPRETMWSTPAADGCRSGP